MSNYKSNSRELITEATKNDALSVSIKQKNSPPNQFETISQSRIKKKIYSHSQAYKSHTNKPLDVFKTRYNAN